MGDQKRKLATEVLDPIWPSDFHFSYHGRPSGYDCIQIKEPKSSIVWYDNYFCWKQGKKNPGFVWSYDGNKPNMRCIRTDEDDFSWHDNYLCVPYSSPFQLYWSKAGEISGTKGCILWKEPHYIKTHDNFLCAQQGCPPLDDIPATYATPGTISYSKERYTNNRIHPGGTLASFQCNYSPFYHKTGTITCTGSTSWDKEVGNECQLPEDPNKRFCLLPGSFGSCPLFTYLTKDDCKQAGLSLGGSLKDGKIVDGNWLGLPHGC